MKAYILYRPNTENERTVVDFHHDFEKQTQRSLELVSLDTREGSDKAALYGIVRYPAIVAVDDSGKLLKMWEGQLPLINELSYFVQD